MGLKPIATRPKQEGEDILLVRFDGIVVRTAYLNGYVLDAGTYGWLPWAEITNRLGYIGWLPTPVEVIETVPLDVFIEGESNQAWN